MRGRAGKWAALTVTGLAAVALAVLLAIGFSRFSSGGVSGASMPSDYWRLPLAPQGEAPDHWSAPERSLAPESCAECHADQYEQWRTSLHAGAFSPGLVGQLLTYDAGQISGCMQCHAPLAEQPRDFKAAREKGVAHLATGQGLAAAGVACGACHLRGHRRFGPPQRDTGATGQSDTDAPHGGVYRAAWFEESEFCAACHQFPQDYAVNGKPLENTVVEWQESPFAAEGVTCQTCHMPDRRHLWRGIHDPDMVAKGLTARFSATAEGARFTLTNSGVGHAFPTYVTPRVEMRAVALDDAGRPVPATAARHVIQRIVSSTARGWIELADSRLLPGEEASLFLPWQGYAKARLWLEVKPDDYYDNQVYDVLLAGLAPDSPSAALVARADRIARASSYRLFVTEIERP